MPYKDKEQRKKYWRDYYSSHRDIKLKQMAISNKNNPKRKEYMRKYCKKYNIIHKEKINDVNKKHYIEHKDYYASKDNKRKREMGYNPLNTRFEGSHGHHIDTKNVIFIPKDVHRSIYHNHKKHINPEHPKLLMVYFLH